ncbi:cupin domain-containing protein [Tepidanaerobacter sp. GT38]|uniref:cupin domain-containing protein n=1 Tax=Tepidanaerobacter sp. GT38 TaxID=2722793 RepID=UPI001F34BB10|nr:cupin domain-containing protein [Tepidanaerobacter sp. GT38]MCG1011525.1 cupin domain-containing protein [Tepidanaerobacter sp. GT38]
MGANIKLLKLHETRREDETTRMSRNFVKRKEFNCATFNSGDYGTYLSGGFVPEHTHSDIEEVFYFTRGSGIVILDGKEIPVSAGDVICVPPGVRHGIKNNGLDVLEHIVCSAKI